MRRCWRPRPGETRAQSSPRHRRQGIKKDHPSRSYQFNHRIQRWAAQVEATYRQPYCLDSRGGSEPVAVDEDRGSTAARRFPFPVLAAKIGRG